MSTKKAITPDAVMQLGLGFMASKTLLSAIELGLFTVLAEGPLTAEQLTAKLKLHPRSARDFYDALVSLGMLERNRWYLLQHSRVGPLPGERQTQLPGWNAGDGE